MPWLSTITYSAITFRDTLLTQIIRICFPQTAITMST